MRLHVPLPAYTFVFMSDLTTISIEKEVLQHYKNVADIIVQKHISMLCEVGKTTIPVASNHRSNNRLQLINDELTANADKILSEIKALFFIDCQKLREHLFVIQKDHFNDFLKKTEFEFAF